MCIRVYMCVSAVGLYTYYIYICAYVYIYIYIHRPGGDSIRRHAALLPRLREILYTSVGASERATGWKGAKRRMRAGWRTTCGG